MYTVYEFRRTKIMLFRSYTDGELLSQYNAMVDKERNRCGYAAMHAYLEIPYAKREIKRRGL